MNYDRHKDNSKIINPRIDSQHMNKGRIRRGKIIMNDDILNEFTNVVDLNSVYEVLRKIILRLLTIP